MKTDQRSSSAFRAGSIAALLMLIPQLFAIFIVPSRSSVNGWDLQEIFILLASALIGFARAQSASTPFATAIGVALIPMLASALSLLALPTSFQPMMLTGSFFTNLIVVFTSSFGSAVLGASARPRRTIVRPVAQPVVAADAPKAARR